VALVTKPVVHGAGATVEAVCFPVDGMLSMFTDLDDGMRAEVGLTDAGGVVDASVAPRVHPSFNECVGPPAADGTISSNASPAGRCWPMTAPRAMISRSDRGSSPRCSACTVPACR